MSDLELETQTEDKAGDVAVTVGDGPEGLVEEDLLVEDVSIDGMCGVY